MLPEALSNGLCSLKPDVDRLCMVCDINLSRLGKVTGYEFYPAVMHSQARLCCPIVAASRPLEDIVRPGLAGFVVLVIGCRVVRRLRVWTHIPLSGPIAAPWGTESEEAWSHEGCHDGREKTSLGYVFKQ